MANSAEGDVDHREKHFGPVGHGIVELHNEDGGLRLIPIPSSDPNDPLRTPEWRKVLILVSVSLFTAGGMTVANSLSAIIPTLTEYYDQAESPPSSETISELGSFPSLFIGIGAILSVIAAQGLGTRLVMIFESLLVVLCFFWAATSTGEGDRGLKSHLAALCFASLGVGAAESLVPLILQDINYIHNRNSRLAINWAAGGVVSSATLFKPWVGVVPETSWLRTAEDYMGTSITDENGFAAPVRPSRRDRSDLYSLRLKSEHSGVNGAWQLTKDLVRCSAFPNIIWCRAALVPLAIESLVVVPIAGLGSDFVVRYMATFEGGLHRPEHQLFNMIFPIIVGFLGTLLFGIFCANPEKYHWSLPMLTGFQFFSVMSVNVITATYVIECFPDLAGPMVIVVGAYRNIIGFGLSYGAQSFVDHSGFTGCFSTYAALIAFLGIFVVPFYLKGLALRERMESWSIRRSRTAQV